ncbi:hypothetical protein D3C83_231570 [compost metagenome]
MLNGQFVTISDPDLKGFKIRGLGGKMFGDKVGKNLGQNAKKKQIGNSIGNKAKKNKIGNSIGKKF